MIKSIGSNHKRIYNDPLTQQSTQKLLKDSMPTDLSSASKMINVEQPKFDIGTST